MRYILFSVETVADVNEIVDGYVGIYPSERAYEGRAYELLKSTRKVSALTVIDTRKQRAKTMHPWRFGGPYERTRLTRIAVDLAWSKWFKLSRE